MKKKVIMAVAVAVVMLGCARVRVEAPKEAIKVDISMRLDIYQHVSKDIDDIENIVSGQKAIQKKSNGQSLLNLMVSAAYAQDSLGQEVEDAAIRRRDRKAELVSWQSQGVVGENRSAQVQIIVASAANVQLQALVNAENSDRKIIYQAIAKKNQTPVEQVQQAYALRLQNDAPAGTPIETLNGATGSYEWKVK